MPARSLANLSCAFPDSQVPRRYPRLGRCSGQPGFAPPSPLVPLSASLSDPFLLLGFWLLVISASLSNLISTLPRLGQTFPQALWKSLQNEQQGQMKKLGAHPIRPGAPFLKPSSSWRKRDTCSCLNLPGSPPTILATPEVFGQTGSQGLRPLRSLAVTACTGAICQPGSLLPFEGGSHL